MVQPRRSTTSRPALPRSTADVLPAHAAPEVVVPVPGLPAIVDGKLGTAELLRRLPTPNDVASDRAPGAAAPEPGPVPDGTAAEVARTVIDIYRAVLGRDQIQPNDTFVGLGGHSLLAFQLLDECQTRLAVKPDITVLFTGTVADVVDHLTRNRSAVAAASTP